MSIQMRQDAAKTTMEDKLEIYDEESRLSLHDPVQLPHALLTCHNCFCCIIQYLVVVLYINGVATFYRNKRNNFLPKTKISDDI